MAESPLDLAVEEQLDALDPLRHLRHDTVRDIVPLQPPSILNQTLDLTFPSPPHAHPISIRLAVDASPGCGGIAWPAGQVLSTYIAARAPLTGNHVLELGSGTGLVGLVAALRGADVVITDQAPLLDIMSRNVRINRLSHRVSVLELNWGQPLPQPLPSFDLILAADCVYFEPAFPLLVQTLRALADRQTHHRPEFLFSYKKRRKADKRFFTLLKKSFSWQEVSDDPNKDVYAREAISLLRLTPK